MQLAPFSLLYSPYTLFAPIVWRVLNNNNNMQNLVVYVSAILQQYSSKALLMSFLISSNTLCVLNKTQQECWSDVEHADHLKHSSNADAPQYYICQTCNCSVTRGIMVLPLPNLSIAFSHQLWLSFAWENDLDAWKLAKFHPLANSSQLRLRNSSALCLSWCFPLPFTTSGRPSHGRQLLMQ